MVCNDGRDIGNVLRTQVRTLGFNILIPVVASFPFNGWS
jgi:hypothetical protein